ncbi:hypothetical protein ACRALDRAFT_2104735 [Sodiomyces alcalophilus JCM 7366]|uniref:uncharacterized protein n=1 Tax=Sodiomyces alcalophilus JCM 7366 TaxID=591952 RepID=UPI0039B6ACF6
MIQSPRFRWAPRRLALATLALASGAMGDNVLSTIGFTNCGPNEAISVQRVDISYNHGNRTITFDVEGTSNKEQNVTAELRVTAYGNEIYANSFDPCDRSTFVAQLCPVPKGTFGARGVQEIPAEFADMVPNIAFQVPDIAAAATLELNSKENGGENIACIQSRVTNGKTTDLAVVSYVAAGVAGLALVATGVSAVGAVLSGGGSVAGSGTPSPSFTETVGWFQGMAMNGMLSVNYPPVYRSFTKNFAFSTGLLPWTQLQQGIDNFRGATGGDLTKDSFELLRKTTLVFPDGSTSQGNEGYMRAKRALQEFSVLLARQIETSVGEVGEGSGSGDADEEGGLTKTVEGIQAYVQQLSVPQSNTFMTVFLIVAIVIAAIVVSILLVKVVLELWALFGSFPKSLTGFRQHYWGSIARTITSLILLLYGVWVLYCVFQFTHGDSWAAKTLAGATLTIFTSVLAFFSWKIWSTARKLKKAEGDTSGLYDKKENWVKYSLFYDSYKKDYWWLFLPVILYMFAKGCIIAAGNGHGLAQASGQLIVEALLLGLLLWKKPFERRSGNIIHIVIQVVRVLSVACILVFVEQFGIEQTTQTMTGVALIAVQSALTGILAILIIWNAVEACCKTNPHRKRRKEMEKMQRDMDTLTPLDARNSLLLDRKDPEMGPNGETTFSMATTVEKRQSIKARAATPDPYDRAAAAMYNSYRHKNSDSNGSNGSTASYRALTQGTAMMYGHQRNQSRENLVSGAAPVGQDLERQPTLPNVGGGWDSSYDNGGNGYSGYRQYRGY